MTTEAGMETGARTRTEPIPGVRAPWELHDLLGVPRRRTSEGIAELVRSSLGVEAVSTATRLEDVDYAFGSPATGALLRLRGLDTEGREWSLFGKLLQHVRHWSMLTMMRPEQAEQFAREFPWRSELELWHEPVLATLPEGLRAPVLHRLVELTDERVMVWMEDVAQDPSPWDLHRFSRAAHLLGRWNARSGTPAVLAAASAPPGLALRMYAERALPQRGLAPLADDGLWAHPWLRDHADLRARVSSLGARIPAWLDRLDALPQAMPHGDASPQNLLVPAGGAEGFVVIDIAFRSPHALGFDLGQLLVGLVHAGELPANRMSAVADAIEPAYVDGLAAEGVPDAASVVHEAFTTSAMLRGGFDGLRYELLEESRPEDRAAFDERLALTRFLAGRLP